MNLHLIFPPVRLANTTQGHELFNVLEKLDALLAKAAVISQTLPVSAWWCAQYGWTTPPQSLPLAALSAPQDIPPQVLAQHPYWMLVQPVHLALQRDTFEVRKLEHIAATSCDALLGSLNAHFAQDGMAFHVGASGQWYLGMQHYLPIEVLLPEQVDAQRLNHVLPTGEGAVAWRRISNEIQMLLFEHAVNQQREAQGLPSISSFWLYGGTQLTPSEIQSAQQVPSTVYTQSALVSGLAVQTATTVIRETLSPALFEVALETRQGGHVVWDDAGVLSMSSMHALQLAMRRGVVSQLTCSFSVGGQLLHYQTSRWDRLKLWRKHQPLVQALGLHVATW